MIRMIQKVLIMSVFLFSVMGNAMEMECVGQYEYYLKKVEGKSSLYYWVDGKIDLDTVQEQTSLCFARPQLSVGAKTISPDKRIPDGGFFQDSIVRLKHCGDYILTLYRRKKMTMID